MTESVSIRHRMSVMWLTPKRIATLCSAPLVFAATGAVGAGPANVDSQPSGLESPNCSSHSGPTKVQTVTLPGRPGFLLLAKNRLWVAIAAPRPWGRGAIAQIDVDSGEIQRILPLPINPYQLAFGFGSLWVTGETTDRRYQDGLLGLNPETGRVVRVIRGPRFFGSKIATTTDAVWIGGADIFPKGHSERAGVRFVYKIDPQRNAVVRRVKLPAQATVIDLAGSGGSLWSAGWWGVNRLSASGRVLFRQSIDGSGWSLAVTQRAVWVAQPWLGQRPIRQQNRPARRLLRIATSGTPRVTTIDLHGQPGGVSAAGGIVWLAAEGGLARLTASETPPTLTKIPLDFSTSSIEAFPGGVWVSELRANRVSKIC